MIKVYGGGASDSLALVILDHRIATRQFWTALDQTRDQLGWRYMVDVEEDLTNDEVTEILPEIKT